MIGARVAHTSTRLADGRVLVAGGVPDDAPAASQASAELYDPSTGRFAPTGPLVTGRYEHAAVALADGRVLVAGGSNDHGNPLTAEIYDPAAGTFTVAASASEPHVGPIRPPRRRAGPRRRRAAGDLRSAGLDPVVIPAPRADRTFTEAATPDQLRSGSHRHPPPRWPRPHHRRARRRRTATRMRPPSCTTRDRDVLADRLDVGLARPDLCSAGPVTGIPARGRPGRRDRRHAVRVGHRDLRPLDRPLHAQAGSIAKEGGIIKRPVTAVQLADGRIIAFRPPAGVGGDAERLGLDRDLPARPAARWRHADERDRRMRRGLPRRPGRRRPGPA